MMLKSHQIISNCWINRRIYDPLHSIKLQFSFTNSSIQTDYSTWLRNNTLRVVKILDYVKRFSWKGHLERTRSWKVFNWIVWSWNDSPKLESFAAVGMFWLKLESWNDINVFENFPSLTQAFQLLKVFCLSKVKVNCRNSELDCTLQRPYYTSWNS